MRPYQCQDGHRRALLRGKTSNGLCVPPEDASGAPVTTGDDTGATRTPRYATHWNSVAGRT